jgi:hypothetical protein
MGPNIMTVKYFDSLQSFVAALPHESKMDKSGPFTNYQSFETAKKNLWAGQDKTAVERAERLLDALECDGIELKQATWELDRVGFIPCVPAHLAGSPAAMRRQVEEPSEAAPVRIFASVATSAALSTCEIEKRGVHILALCRKLAAVRPVELYIFEDMHGKDEKDGTGACAIPVIKLETLPLDLTTAAYVLTNPGFPRSLCFAWGAERGFTGKWARFKNSHGTAIYPNTPGYMAELRRVLQANPQDLVIMGGFSGDPLVANPLKWLNMQVSQYARTLE